MRYVGAYILTFNQALLKSIIVHNLRWPNLCEYYTFTRILRTLVD